MADALLEICVDSPDGLAAAIDGGADRIELCAALDLGGLTPSPGLMVLAARAPVPVHAMIRPRPGDFCFTADDVAAMEADIEAARRAGLAGVVLGASRPDGSLDGTVLARLVARSSGLDRTLHRAFDGASADFAGALALATELGFRRILSSGGAQTAVAGAATLADLARRAGSLVVIMPGAGIDPEAVATLRRVMPVSEVHASCSHPAGANSPGNPALSGTAGARRITSAAKVRALKAALRG